MLNGRLLNCRASGLLEQCDGHEGLDRRGLTCVESTCSPSVIAVVTPNELPQSNHSMEHFTNPYSPPTGDLAQEPSNKRSKRHRGPVLYFALAGIIGAALAIPLIVPKSLSVTDDPNPIGYLLIIVSFPVGGLIYRLRSRKWPIDMTVRLRQLWACFATLLLPTTLAVFTGMRGQGLHMTILSAGVSLIFMAAILISGQRRGRNMA